jgi:putative cell wall-binding protein
MTRPPSARRRLAFGGGVAALVAATSLLPVAAAGASAATEVIQNLQCPQPVASATLPYLVKLETGWNSLKVVAGNLPAGLAILPSSLAINGILEKEETANFRLEATRTLPDGTPGVATRDCTITVKKAPTVVRIAGADRYQQALSVSAKKFTKANIVYIASGEKYADALSATAIAAQVGAPLLLTPSAALPAGLTAEITRLGAKDIVVVGGETSVSAAVEAQLDAATTADITRIGGADRYEVSRNLITNQAFGVVGTIEGTGIFIATGATFPDALTASPAAATIGAPVLLVNGSEAQLTVAEAAVLNDRGVERVFIAGGPASVSESLASSLGKTFTTSRFGGDNRFDVGVNINKTTFSGASNVYLASGLVFPDALSGGVVAGMEKAPLYVTPSNCVDGDVLYDLGRLAPDTVTILGGPNTLGAGVESLTTCGFD